MANSFCFVCKKHYLHLIQADLQTSTIFEPCPIPQTSLFATLTTKLSALNILPGLLSFPNYKALMKLHKIPSAARFIVAARNVVTTPAAILLCKFTKAVDPFLVSLLKENFAKVPDFPWHTHSTILKNSANMVQVVTAINHRGLVDTVSFQAGDVARLYTNIPLAALKIRLKALYKRLFDSRAFI